MWKTATWVKGTKRITGSWFYSWASQRFVIALDGHDPYTGLRREPFEVSGDEPEFGGWRLKK